MIRIAITAEAFEEIARQLVEARAAPREQMEI